MILVCPTGFKGTLSAADAAAAMAEGARAAAPGLEVRLLPLSDGGNGLLDGLRAARGGRVREARVTGPLGEPVVARFLVQGTDAVVETAEACGFHLVAPERRDPMRATTTGVGELLLAAAGAGGAACGAPLAAERLVVGLGGSATVDAGAGLAMALGWRLLDEAGAPIPHGGAGLLRLHRIDAPRTPPRLPPLVTLADVTSPLLGPDGAAAVYAPQKGATPEQVERLEAGLARWADVVARDLGRRVAGLPGAGAAGGLGAAFAAFLDSPPRSGADWILDAVGFDDLLASATAVVTGEGSWDAQSSLGKVTGEVVARAGVARVPVLLVAGRVAGPIPRGVEAVDGAGATLGAADLAGMVRDRLPALLRPAGSPYLQPPHEQATRSDG
jgi:glycerate 2-kinase